MKASEFMESSLGLVCGDRKDAYGSDPMPGFERIALMMNAVLTIAGKAPKRPIDAHDVCQIMVGLKIARSYTGPLQIDNYVDAVGWSALAGEAATAMAKRGAA